MKLTSLNVFISCLPNHFAQNLKIHRFRFLTLNFTRCITAPSRLQADQHWRSRQIVTCVTRDRGRRTVSCSVWQICITVRRSWISTICYTLNVYMYMYTLLKSFKIKCCYYNIQLMNEICVQRTVLVLPTTTKYKYVHRCC